MSLLALLWQLGVLPEGEVAPPEAGEAAGGGGGQRDEGGEDPGVATGETDLIPPQLLTMNCSPSPTENPIGVSTDAYEHDRLRFVNSGTEDMQLELYDALPEPPGALSPGAWHEVPLDEIGKYQYLCTFPSGIQSGSITVKG